jgi:8-amino-7-oxononanoate synthase
MDGDAAPLEAIAGIAQQHGAHLIVDEAHATGVFGRGLVEELNLQARVFAKVVTFGKALGCHGAVVLGSNLLRNYLVNFSRSFIYTTAASFHQLAAIKMACNLLPQSGPEQELLHNNIKYFKERFIGQPNLIPSDSAIQCLLLKSNDKAKALSGLLQTNGFDVRPILSPTVAAGSERVRICLHSFNTVAELKRLTELINQFITG